MAKHLTDREKKKIIADYAECGNYSQVARKHKVSFEMCIRDSRTTEALNVEPLRFFVAKSKGEDLIPVRAHYRRIHKRASGQTDIQGGE